MTKKHFEALARSLKAAHPVVLNPHFNNEGTATWASCVVNVTDVCQSFNPNFDRARFIAACTPEGV